MSYSLAVSADGRGVDLTLTMDTKEGDRRRKFPSDTWIRTTRESMRVYTLPPSDSRRILGVVSTSTDRGQQDYSGQVHGWVKFPDLRGLTRIKVSFDRKGRKDPTAQGVTAVLGMRIQLGS